MGCYPSRKKPTVVPAPKKDQENKTETEMNQENNLLKTFVITHRDFVREGEDDIREHYQLLSPPIGKGSFGEVRKAMNKLTKKFYAVKIIPYTRRDREDEQSLYNEIGIMKKLDHPHVLQLHEFYRDWHFFYLVSDLCEGGDLIQKVRSTLFNEEEAAKIMKQMLIGVNYLHKNGIVHRDLKPENIMFESGTLKILDFGIASTIKRGFQLHKVAGTTIYMAPEVFKGNYNEKCDIWSCGVIMYLLLSGHVPFEAKTSHECEEKILHGKVSFKDGIWKSASKEVKDFILCMLERNVEKRYSAEQALEHPWFTATLKEKRHTNKIASIVLNNLYNYSSKKKLQDAIWVYMVSQFAAEDDKTRLIEIFESLDVDKNGHLDKNEILEGFKRFYEEEISEKEVDEIFERIDRNSNGKLDYTEFVIATVDRKKLLAKKNLETTFKLIDKDGSQAITADELKNFFEGSSPKKEYDENLWEVLVKEVDSNSDGKISFQEFKDMMMKLAG